VSVSVKLAVPALYVVTMNQYAGFPLYVGSDWSFAVSATMVRTAGFVELVVGLTGFP